MTAGRRRVLLGVVTASLLAACARPPQSAPADAVHPRSIAIIGVSPAETITLKRRWFVGAAFERIDRISKQREFETRYQAERAAVADALTSALVAAAQRRGFTTVAFDANVSKQRDPEQIVDDVRRRTDADLVLHVRVRDIGVFNLLSSSNYEPGIDTEVKVVARSTGFEVVDENFYYGANATRKAFWSIPSDPADRWPDFEAVMDPQRGVPASWRKGVDAVARRIIEQLPTPASH